MLFDGAMEELLLEGMVGVGSAGDDEEARGLHVETVDHHRAVVVGVTLAQDVLDREAVDAAGHGEHARRLAHNDERRLFADDDKVLCRGLALGHALVLDVEALEHEGQNGLALAPTGRVVVTVMTHLATGRGSLPELGDGKGTEAVEIGILQELGCAAVARAARG